MEHACGQKFSLRKSKKSTSPPPHMPARRDYLGCRIARLLWTGAIPYTLKFNRHVLVACST